MKDGAIVTASGQVAAPVYDPKLEVQVPKAGQPMIQLANTGNVTLRVAVVGRGCEAPPDVVIPPRGPAAGVVPIGHRCTPRVSQWIAPAIPSQRSPSRG